LISGSAALTVCTFPDLDHIEHKYAGQPVVVVGVHSASSTMKVVKQYHAGLPALQRTHPVIVDQNVYHYHHVGIGALGRHSWSLIRKEKWSVRFGEGINRDVR
jgi:hypothetical protein